MPLIEWIMQNLQISYPSILIGGSSAVSIQYRMEMNGGIRILGTAVNTLTQGSCTFVICEQGVFCYHKQQCSCNTIMPLAPYNGLRVANGSREAMIAAIVRCGRPDLLKIFKQINNSLAHIPYFVGPPKYPFVAR